MNKLLMIVAVLLVATPALAERNESRSDGKSSSGCACDNATVMGWTIDQYGNPAPIYRSGMGYSTNSSGKTSSGGHDTQSPTGSTGVSPKGDEY